jgi:hypothetical protein
MELGLNTARESFRHLFSLNEMIVLPISLLEARNVVSLHVAIDRPSKGVPGKHI